MRHYPAGRSPIATISQAQTNVSGVNMKPFKPLSATKKDEIMFHFKNTNYDKNLRTSSTDESEGKCSKVFMKPTKQEIPTTSQTTAIISYSSPSPSDIPCCPVSPIAVVSTATVLLTESPRNGAKTPQPFFRERTSGSPPSSPSLSFSQHSPRAGTALGPISRFTFGESSSGTSIDAQTECSEHQNIHKHRKSSVIFNRNRNSISPQPERKELASENNKNPGRSSPITQRALKQLRWCSSNRRPTAAYMHRTKLSREDSMMTTLMTSLDQVPELGGHLDMDSTSCSLCSSGEDDPPSMPRGHSPSFFPRTALYSDSPSESEVTHNQPVNFISKNDGDDDTLGSNSDYTIEGDLDDQDDFLPSPNECHSQFKSNTSSPINTNLISANSTPCGDANTEKHGASKLNQINNEGSSESSRLSRLSSSPHPEIASSSLDSRSHESDQTVIDCIENDCQDRNDCSDLTESSSSKNYLSLGTMSQSLEVNESHILPIKCQSLDDAKAMGDSSSTKFLQNPKVEHNLKQFSLPDS